MAIIEAATVTHIMMTITVTKITIMIMRHLHLHEEGAAGKHSRWVESHLLSRLLVHVWLWPVFSVLPHACYYNAPRYWIPKSLVHFHNRYLITNPALEHVCHFQTVSYLSQRPLYHTEHWKFWTESHMCV